MNWRLILAVGWVLVILGICWLPQHQMPPTDQLPFMPHFDKFVHGIMFLVFGVLWGIALRGRWGRIALAGIALAVITELGQAISQIGRTADPIDGAVDIIGLAVGLGLSELLGKVWPLSIPVPENG